MFGLNRLRPLLAAALIAAAPLHPPAAEPDAAMLEAVRAADLRVATIGFRLASANAAACDRLEPGLGLQLHSLDQFDAADRGAANVHFGFRSPVAVEGVVAGGPAAAAGLRADDSLVAVGPVQVAALPGRAGTTDRLVAAQLAIAALPPDQPLPVTVLRAEGPVTVTVRPVPACRSRFELVIGKGWVSSADGTMVRIGSPFLERYDDAAIAAVLAHELSHNLLRHRQRLSERGVDWGMLSGLGGNVKYFRQTELQADLLSVWLLANAGWPPEAAPDFWRRFGPDRAGGPFRSRTHPAWRDRVATLEAEIARMRALPPGPRLAPILQERERPLDGDWQALLVRSR
jgi:hypothetical protein